MCDGKWHHMMWYDNMYSCGKIKKTYIILYLLLALLTANLVKSFLRSWENDFKYQKLRNPELRNKKLWYNADDKIIDIDLILSVKENNEL